MYEYWLRFYGDKSYILILDFRDTFFQANPFGHLPNPPATRPHAKYELSLFQENYKVKNIGKCVFNSLWIGRCFGKEALQKLKAFPVICSGSTIGSFSAIHHYVRTMLQSMDTVQCWKKVMYLLMFISKHCFQLHACMYVWIGHRERSGLSELSILQWTFYLTRWKGQCNFVRAG